MQVFLLLVILAVYCNAASMDQSQPKLDKFDPRDIVPFLYPQNGHVKKTIDSLDHHLNKAIEEIFGKRDQLERVTRSIPEADIVKCAKDFLLELVGCFKTPAGSRKAKLIVNQQDLLKLLTVESDPLKGDVGPCIFKALTSFVLCAVTN